MKKIANVVSIETENVDFINKIFDEVMGNEKNGVCSICGKPYDDYGHNAKPYVNGRCCSECNKTYVTPTRMYLFSKGAENTWSNSVKMCN